MAEKQIPGVKIVSRYLDLEDHSPAMLEIEIGKGLAFLSGVHFEYSTRFLKKRERSLSHLYTLLSQSEVKRKTLFKEIMNRLGIPTITSKSSTKKSKCVLQPTLVP